MGERNRFTFPKNDIIILRSKSRRAMTSEAPHAIKQITLLIFYFIWIWFSYMCDFPIILTLSPTVLASFFCFRWRVTVTLKVVHAPPVCVRLNLQRQFSFPFLLRFVRFSLICTVFFLSYFFSLFLCSVHLFAAHLGENGCLWQNKNHLWKNQHE